MWDEDEVRFRHANHTYTVERDEIDNNRKVFHRVERPDGRTTSIPFTPYETMTLASFTTYVEMGAPESSRGWIGSENATVNFNNDSLTHIREVAERHNIALSKTEVLQGTLRLAKS